MALSACTPGLSLRMGDITTGRGRSGKLPPETEGEGWGQTLTTTEGKALAKQRQAVDCCFQDQGLGVAVQASRNTRRQRNLTLCAASADIPLSNPWTIPPPLWYPLPEACLERGPLRKAEGLSVSPNRQGLSGWANRVRAGKVLGYVCGCRRALRVSKSTLA